MLVYVALGHTAHEGDDLLIVSGDEAAAIQAAKDGLEKSLMGYDYTVVQGWNIAKGCIDSDYMGKQFFAEDFPFKIK